MYVSIAALKGVGILQCVTPYPTIGSRPRLVVLLFTEVAD